MEFVGKFFKDRRLWLISIVVFGLLIVVFDKDSTVLENLKNDRYLEQYAREHYLMKRKEETIYLVR